MIPFPHYTDELQRFLNRVIITDCGGQVLNTDEGLSVVVAHLQKMKAEKKKAMIIGNGGSAAIASHLQNDLCKATKIRAMVFTDPPLLTALSNDICYAAAYRELVDLWGDKGDMLIAISSSGRSQNIISAVATAREKGCNPIVTISGFLMDNPLRSLGDLNMYVPSTEYGYVELAHSVLAHYISDQMSKSE
jgi:D-sedoheptulose 7-phosphate isomerase